MQVPHLLHLNQESLSCLETNPRKFQQFYLEREELPKPPAIQQRQDIGKHFHLLIKQQLMGLPVNPLLKAYPQFAHWIANLQLAAPHIFTPTPPHTLKECEYPCTLMFEGHLLGCVYDFLIADDDTAQIIEWTTGSMPSRPKLLKNNWQTRLYLYVLAEQGDYKPSEISITYWFVHSAELPQSLKFTYNTAQREKTRKQLMRLVTQLNRWLLQLETGVDFPSTIRSENTHSPRPEQFKTAEVLAKKEILIPSREEIEEVSI